MIQIIKWQDMRPGVKIYPPSPAYEGEYYTITEVGEKWHQDSRGESFKNISCVWHDGIPFRTVLYKRDSRTRID